MTKTTNQKAAKAAKALPSVPVWTSLLMDYGFWTATRHNLYELMAIYQKNDVVHGCIDIIAKQIVAANPCLMRAVNEGAKNLQTRGLRRLSTKRAKRLRRQWDDQALKRIPLGDDEEVVDASGHDFYNALDYSDIDSLYFIDRIRLAVISMCVYGLAFWERIRAYPGGPTIGYQYLPTYNMMPDRTGDGQLKGWYYCSQWGYGEVTKQPLAKEDVLIFRWPSTTDPQAGGDSPLLAALRKVELSNKWTEWQDWLVSNRARPDWLFIPKVPDGASLTQEQIDKSEKKINDKFRGAGNGRVAVADGPGTAIPLTFPPTDMAPLAFNEELRKALLFVLNVPEAFSNNDGNRANLEGSLEQFSRQALAPITTIFEAVLTREVKTVDPQLMVVFENVIPEDKAFELQEQKDELQKWVGLIQFSPTPENVNDYRVNVLGLDPLDIPEPTPAATVEPPADAAAPAEPPAVPDAPDAKAFDLLALNKSVAKGDIDRATAISLAAYALGIDEVDAKKLVTHPRKAKAKTKELKPPTVPASEKLADLIRLQQDKQKSHYLHQLTGNKSATDLDTKSADDGLPAKFTSLDEWDGEDMQLYKPYIQAAYQKAADNRIKAYVNVGAEEGTFGVVPDKIDEAVNNASLQFAQSTNDTTEQNINDALDELRQQLKDGIGEGDSVTRMRQRIEDIFEAIDAERADLIARTEISRATHESQKIVAKASGIVKGFRLLASADCCDECAEFDGTEISLDGKFNEADDYSDTPVPIHPNCRCTMLEVLDLGDDE